MIYKNEVAYCYECDKNVDYVLKSVKKKIVVRECEIVCTICECFCAECGSKILVESVEKQNEKKVYDLYKEKNGLLTSTEIANILAKRKMTQKQLAAFLCIGEKDITRYMNGAIQSKNIDKMLRLVNDDTCFLRMKYLFENKEIHLGFTPYLDGPIQLIFSEKINDYSKNIFYESKHINTKGDFSNGRKNSIAIA